MKRTNYRRRRYRKRGYVRQTRNGGGRTAVLRVLIFLAGICVLVGIDRITKALAVKYLKGGDVVRVVGDYLTLCYTENRGAAFSLLLNHRAFLIGFPLALSAACVAVIVSGKIKTIPLNISFMLIAAGGIGNLIDRVSLGYVVDFIYLKKINFAIFNAADCCVTVGVVLLILLAILDDGIKGRGRRRRGFYTGRKNF